MRSQNLPCWDQGLRGLTQPRRPQGSDTSSYVIQNRTFFRLWGTPLAQPIWRIAAFYFGTTTTKSCNAQQHIGQRGHRRKPSVLLNSCLDPCFQENDELRNSLVFSSRGAPLQGFHGQLEVCWGLWQTPSFRPCVRFRAVFSLAFSLAHMSCEVPAWDQLCFFCRAMQQTEKAHLGTLYSCKCLSALVLLC